MANSTTNISNVSISVSGKSTKTATISWTKPTLPANVTITSCTLTGSASSFTTGSKGATLTIGSTSVSSGSSFTVNLGNNNSTTSVTASFKGNHKQSNTSVTLSNLVYTVNYTENYTVTFVDWNGTVLKTQSVASGGSATAPSNPSRTGYKFIGWDKTFTNITSDLIVTAQYEQIITYTVTFVDYDGTILKTQTVEAGTAATAPTSPSREGYSFSGWDKSFSNVTSDLTVTARYAIIVYIVTFVNYDGSILKTEEVTYGNAATAPTNPSRVGYNFIGWDKTFSNVTSRLTVTAQYEAIKYTVTFLDYDGSILKTEEVTYGNSATAPSVSRYGYTLTGWSVDFSNVTSNITTMTQYAIVNVLNIKENGSWINIGKVFRKINGVWIEQTNNEWNTLFNTNTDYRRKEIPYIPTAILYEDGTLIFSPDYIVDESHGNIVATYTGWDTDVYTLSSMPWYSNKSLIKKVYFNDISAKSTKYWLYGFAATNVEANGVNNVTDMTYMFSSCQALTSLNLSNFNTSNVTDMQYMFFNCFSLTSLNLSNFNTSNVTDMTNMFNGCSSLTSLNLSSFDTSNVSSM